MATGSELSRIDQTILRYCDSESAEEISRRLGHVITPERVAAQKEQLLTSKKWLTATQEEELVLYRMRNVLAQLEEQFLDLDNASVQLRYLKEIGNRLDKRREATQFDLETYDLNVAREMTRVYEIALGFMKGALRGEIDPDVWDEVAREALAHAGAEVAKKAIEE
ncbi:hypothetical protein [Streptomyces sp. AC495_CC817]|uniref:hypothetical protein n=1 Tax=Streptomyces sp. AC495_CC817 TaxID=2823900 RepID=UPI001C25FC2E|nr:hypothetical protein [Streptomyces sp. AC495_CC817]